MSESYCLKSCTECGREGCAGCKAGAFADQCEIVKCCKEKNHETCESCTRGIYCPTWTKRAQMPEKVFELQRREAELAVKYRNDAQILARWVRIIFIGSIISFAVGLLELIPALSGAAGLAQIALAAAVAYGFYRLKPVDECFGMVAALQLACSLMSLVQTFVPLEGFLDVVLTLVAAVCGLILMKKRWDAFRDSLSGISRLMGEKWENQWKLYKIGLFVLLGCTLLAFVPVLGIIAVIATLAGAGLLIFVSFREYVYLWQTVKACEDFSERQQIF